MKLRREYFWDDITTMEHEDFFPEIDEWAYKNGIVQSGQLIFPVDTEFTPVDSDNYYKFFNVTLPNGNTFEGVPINYSLYDEFEECL